MRVLIAVDGSKGAFETVRQLGAVLSPQRDQVALYHTTPALADMPELAQQEELQARARQVFAEAIFAEAAKLLPTALAERTHQIVDDMPPRLGVLEAADRWPADLIAMGARGLGRIQRLLLGSVSRAVVHSSKVPVWIARGPRQARADGALRVLLTCERPELCRTPAALLNKFTWPAGSSVLTITVISSLLSGRVPEWVQHQTRTPEIEELVKHWVADRARMTHSATAGLAEVGRLLPPSLKIDEPLLAEGETAEQVLATIESRDIDLVVVGSKHKHFLQNMIFGSTLEAVLNHADCSVLVVPEKEDT